MSRGSQSSYQAEEFRADRGIDNLSPIDIFEIARHTPRLTMMRYPLGRHISGICVKHERFSFIAINSAQSLGRQRFTLAHEFYHLCYDKSIQAFVCPQNASKKDTVEQAADSFASQALLPHYALRNELKARNLLGGLFDLEGDDLLLPLLEIEQKYGVSRNALLVRLQEEDLLEIGQKERVSKAVIRNARRLGFSTALYAPSYGGDAQKVDGEYIDLTISLLAREIISEGKAKELLAQGFRDDIHIETIEMEDLFD